MRSTARLPAISVTSLPTPVIYMGFIPCPADMSLMPGGSDHQMQSAEELRERAARFRQTARLVTDDGAEKALIEWADELEARAETLDRIADMA